MSKKYFIAGNFKMYKNISDSIEYLKKLDSLNKKILNRDICICSNFLTLSALLETKNELSSSIIIGAQNMHYEKEGAFTGEISGEMLKDTGINFVIIGHSERRHVFGEDNEFIQKKVKKAISIGLTPIFCVGEKIEQRENGKTQEIIEEQFNAVFNNLNIDEAEKIIIAYEPVWAIGTGKTATPNDAQEVHNFIRNLIKLKFSSDLAEKIRILYGGSVKPENAFNLMNENDIDGVLVGGASLDAESFTKIIQFDL